MVGQIIFMLFMLNLSLFVVGFVFIFEHYSKKRNPNKYTNVKKQAPGGCGGCLIFLF